MKKIELTQGQFALVDDDDFDWLSQWKWHSNFNSSINGFYAKRNCTIDGHRYKISMHRLIMGAKAGEDVDHINHNTLDNRKENLRICSRSQNQHNRGKLKSNTSGYKGVSWDRVRGKWKAKIRNNGTLYNIGYFDSPLDGAKAYDLMAIKLHKEYKMLNFQPETLNDQYSKIIIPS